jgi:hypothetical protein
MAEVDGSTTMYMRDVEEENIKDLKRQYLDERWRRRIVQMLGNKTTVSRAP